MCELDDERSFASLLAVSIGAAISVISVFNNCLVLFCFVRHPRCFRSYFQFLLVLSVFDIIVSVCYIPVIFIDSLKDWLNSVELARLWWTYFVYLLSLTNIAMTAASFVLVGVSLERMMITTRDDRLKSFQDRRGLVCIASLALALATKAPIALELDTFPADDPSCQNTVMEFKVDVTSINSYLFYGVVYKFWIRNIVTIFIPFALLALINLKTVLALKEQSSNAEGLECRRFAIGYTNKSKVRSATWTMLLVCVLYLATNATNVFVTAWEFIDMNHLQENFYEFYMFSTDLVSLLAVTSCALRLPIYLLFNPEIRRLVCQQLQCSRTRQKTLDTFV